MKIITAPIVFMSSMAVTLLLMAGCASGPPVPRLHKMITDNEIEEARKLIQRREGINTLSENGLTPLHLAVGRNHQSLVESLIDAGANLETRTNFGETALIIACRLKTSNIAKQLVERGAQVNPAYRGTNALSEAIRFNHLDLIDLFLKRGANIEIRNHFGETPLFYAVHFGNEESVRLMVKNGANVNAVADDGRTVLHVAAVKQDGAIADLLVRWGATVRDADASEVALYSTAMLHSSLGDSALSRENVEQGLFHLKKAAQYYTRAAQKFEQVASNHETAVSRTQSSNTLSVAFAAVAAFGQAHTQASTMAQVTPRGQTATGYGMAPYAVQGTERLESLVKRYRALALKCKDSGAQLLAQVSCVETRSGANLACKRGTP